jgi:hypothetical protein
MVFDRNEVKRIEERKEELRKPFSERHPKLVGSVIWLLFFGGLAAVFVVGSHRLHLP